MCLLLLLLTAGFSLTHAQTTISTTSSLTNDETAATVTFNFQNTNAFPVIITDLSGVLSGYGSQSVSLWYKTSSINGAPGAIETANGWTLYGSASVISYGNSTTTVTQPFFQGISLTIPANTTYGLAVVGMGSTGTQRVGVLTAAVTQSAGGCNVLTGPNIGYAAAAQPPAAPATASRGWIGTIGFIPGTSCAGTPATPLVSGPPATCSGSGFALSATGYTIAAGVTHQWQYFNTTTTAWVNIAGATNPAQLNVTGGIVATTQYRLVSTCASSSLQGISATFGVTVGAGTLAAGTYTINRNQPASATNFVSFAHATAALNCGINGPVVFNVTPGSGPYYEVVKIGAIPGASAVNTVKINGNGNTVQYMNEIGEVQLLTLSGTKYVKIDSLTFRTLSVNTGWGALLTAGCAYDSLTRCFFDITSVSDNIGSGNVNGIVFSSSSSAPVSFGDNGRVCYLGYNHVKGSTAGGGPFYAICLGGGPNDSNIVIDHNELENFGYYGIYTYTSRNIKIRYNNIHRTTKTANTYFYGINVWGNYSAYNYNLPVKIEVVGNRIHNPSNGLGSTVSAFYGITAGNGWWNDTTNVSDTVLIANNAIYNMSSQVSATVWGILFGNGNSSNTFILHNTVDFSTNSASSGTMYGIWSNYYYWNTNNNWSTQVKNNLVTITGGTTGPKYGFYYNDNLVNTNWYVNGQRNNFYVNSPQPGPQFYGNQAGVDYATKAAYQAAFPTQEVGSLSVNPQYLAPATGDLTPLNTALQGNGLNLQSVVPRDINGNPRSITPTPGAFEFSTDAGITALNAPVGLFCSSVKQVKVTLANLGVNTINTVQVNWSLNGVMQPAVTYTGALGGVGNPPNTTIVTLGNGLFMPNSSTTIKVWSSMPNGLADPINYNDTLVTVVQPSSSLPVNLGPDAAICTGSSYTLNAGSTGSSFLWDNNTVNQTRNVTAAGTYYVKVTGYDGCIGVDTFVLSLRPLPVVDLGPDQAICLGSTTTLDPGNIGASYLWDDGSTAQTRVVDTAGIYTVDVTDNYGCTGTDDIKVIMKDIPRVDGINAIYGDTATYTFNPINPLFILNYTWNFGDGSPLKTGMVVQHRYSTNGIYTVTLSIEGECTGLILQQSRTVDVFDAGGGTGLATVDKDGGLLIYPNPARDWLTVEVNGDLKLKSVTVMNVLGQHIYSDAVNGTTKLRIPASGLAAGVYTVKVETDKGFRTRKFEILK